MVLMRSGAWTVRPSERCTLCAGDKSKATNGVVHSEFVSTSLPPDKNRQGRLTQSNEDDISSPI